MRIKRDAAFAANPPRWVHLLAAALALITALLFWPATEGGFIDLDDDTYVAENPFVQQGLTGPAVRWAFTAVHEDYWAPLTWLSFMADRTFQGSAPEGYHRTNVLLHAVNVALLFLLGWRLTGRPWSSAMVAALFGWHPLRVEAVAWITARKDVLSTCFGLLALLAYARYAQGARASQPKPDRGDAESGRAMAGSFRSALGPPGWYALTALGLALSLMAKPMLVTLPLLLLLLDYWPLQRLNALHPARTLLVLVGEKLPLFVLAAAGSAITLGTHAERIEHTASHANRYVGQVFDVASNYGFYLRQIAWPIPLAVRYPPGPPVHFGTGLAAAAGLMVITALILVAGRRRRWPVTGWLWYLAAFLPVIGFVRVGTAELADRFTYVPFIGCAVMAVGAWTASVSALWHSGRKWARARGAAWVNVAAAAMVLAACAIGTRYQLRFWTESERLFRRALAVTRDNPAAHNSLGRALEGRGRWQEAAEQYQAALRVAPRFAQAHANLAKVWSQLGRYREAITEYEAALASDPRDARLRSNYGATLFANGRRTEGLMELQQAVRLDGSLPDAHYNLGCALLENRETNAALPHIVAAATLNPQDDAAHFLAGRLWVVLGNPAEARRHFTAALRCRPENVVYRNAVDQLQASSP